MSEIDKLHEELNARYEQEHIEKLKQEELAKQQEALEAKQAKVQARKDAVRKLGEKVIHPFKKAKAKRVAKNAAKIVAERKEERRIKAEEAKKAEEERIAAEKHQQKVDAANAEIDEIKAMYDPNKIGKVEITKTEEPRYTYGGKLIPNYITTTIIHTKYGPLIREEMHNPYEHTSHPYYVKYKGFVKKNIDGADQIVYIHQESHLYIPHHSDVQIIEYENFSKTKGGEITFDEHHNVTYGTYDESDVRCEDDLYFNKQLEKYTEKDIQK